MPERQQVDVSPVLHRRVKTLEGEWISEELPVRLRCTSVVPARGRIFTIISDSARYFVQLIFNEVSIDEWVTEASTAVSHNQRFVLQGAVAIPGVSPQSKR